MIALDLATRSLIAAKTVSPLVIGRGEGGYAIASDALSGGRLAAAGLDVYEQEPLAPESPLRSLEHVTLTPHAAAWSEDSLELLRVEMCENVAEWIATGWNHKVVNPEVRSHLRPRL